MKNVEIIDFEKETKRKNRQDKIKQKFNDAKNFVTDNKELIMLFGPIVLGCVTAGIKGVTKMVNLKQEKDVKELYCYDRSLGHYWKLRRELTNSEWLEIDKRKNNGERLSDILDEMKVLK